MNKTILCTKKYRNRVLLEMTACHLGLIVFVLIIVFTEHQIWQLILCFFVAISAIGFHYKYGRVLRDHKIFEISDGYIKDFVLGFRVKSINVTHAYYSSDKKIILLKFDKKSKEYFRNVNPIIKFFDNLFEPRNSCYFYNEKMQTDVKIIYSVFEKEFGLKFLSHKINLSHVKRHLY